MILNENFLEHIRNRDVFCTKIKNASLEWDQLFSWLDTGSLDDTLFCPPVAKGRINFVPLFKMKNLPEFIKQVENEFKELFTMNTIGGQVFANWHKEGDSFPMHKDEMDVFYIQCKNKVHVKIAAEKHGDPILSKELIPGDCVWIPRGLFHKFTILEPRIGLSIGVEEFQKNCVIDPSLYI